jgi:hypothetical protein
LPGRQRRRPTHALGAGLGVDASGGPVIDPTENVLSLVDVEKAHVAEIRALIEKYDDKLRHAEAQRNDELRNAETRRIDQLAALRVQYDEIIEGMRSTSMDRTSTLLATQLQEVKKDLSDRTSELEQFRWASSGRTSVSDPATAEALTKMAAAIESLSGSRIAGTAHSKGIGDSWGVLLGALGGGAILYEILSKIAR